MRIRKKSLPRCRYGGRKNRRIGRHLRQKPKKEYDNGNNDHREQRLPPARREDREDNRLRGGIPEPGGNGAQTERGSGKPCCQGTESRPEVDDAQGGVVCEMLDISHRTLQRYRQKHIIPYSMIGRQIRYPRQAVESLRERWMVETPAAKIDRMIAEHPLHNRKNGSYGKKGRDTGKNQ